MLKGWFSRLCKEQRGFTFIEVLVGVAIMGMIVAAFMLALATAFKANTLADIRTTADSLARAQMEYIKAQAFGQSYNILSVPEDKVSYSIWYDPDADGTTPDDEINASVDGEIIPVEIYEGLQKIILIIKHNDSSVLYLEGFKAER